jgi:dihydrolipoamide dehydrogenase
VSDRGFISVDIQMRSNMPHKVVHEAHVAAEVMAGKLQGNPSLTKAAFNARVIPSVAYTDPEVAWVGLTEEQAKAKGTMVRCEGGGISRSKCIGSNTLKARHPSNPNSYWAAGSR